MSLGSANLVSAFLFPTGKKLVLYSYFKNLFNEIFSSRNIKFAFLF